MGNGSANPSAKSRSATRSSPWTPRPASATAPAPKYAAEGAEALQGLKNADHLVNNAKALEHAGEDAADVDKAAQKATQEQAAADKAAKEAEEKARAHLPAASPTSCPRP
jgi:hypothetical protein